MSIAAKQNFSGVVCLVSAIFMMYCIWRMIPYGMAGEAGKVKLYFTLMIIAFIFSLASGLAYQYYRSKPNEDVERIRAGVDILARAGHKPADAAGKPVKRR